VIVCRLLAFGLKSITGIPNHSGRMLAVISMPDPLTRFQRYRQWAAEYRTRAVTADDDRQRAEYVKLANRYEEIADAAEQVACLFRCPITGGQVHGFIVEEETSGNDHDPYEPVNCLDCGQIHLVNLRTGEAVGKAGQC
jgi:hypothetical protein